MAHIIEWNPYEVGDPGPRIDVVVTNSFDVINAGRESGLEYPAPITIRALIDTGASVTVISKQFAKSCRLFQTGADTQIRGLGGAQLCGEHAGSISFPGTGLRSIESMRIVSAVFDRERHYACLIGRDILRNWLITFDGRNKQIEISD